MSQTIVHEADVQRQHARYRLPVQAQFGDQSFDVLDWSVGGFALAAGRLELAPKRVLSFRLVFPLEDYDIVLPVQAEVRYIDKERGRVGFRFVNTTQRQVSVLRYIIDAFLSGELVTLGDILDVTARSHAAAPRAAPQREQATTVLARLRRAARAMLVYAAVAVATVGLAAFVVEAVYERLFISRPITAAISTDTITLSAPVSGQLEVVTAGPDLVPGEPAIAVRDWSGKQVFVEAKCACPVVERVAQVGSTIQEGAVVLRAAVIGAKPYIRAVVSDDTMIRIREGAVARIEYADGTTASVDLTEHPPISVGVAPIAGSAATAPVIGIDPGRPIGLDQYGTPVRVRFDSLGASVLGRLFG
jgi:alginate biosynthesis protein Alg44